MLISLPINEVLFNWIFLGPLFFAHKFLVTIAIERKKIFSIFQMGSSAFVWIKRRLRHGGRALFWNCESHLAPSGYTKPIALDRLTMLGLPAYITWDCIESISVLTWHVSDNDPEVIFGPHIVYMCVITRDQKFFNKIFYKTISRFYHKIDFYQEFRYENRTFHNLKCTHLY